MGSSSENISIEKNQYVTEPTYQAEISPLLIDNNSEDMSISFDQHRLIRIEEKNLAIDKNIDVFEEETSTNEEIPEIVNIN